MAYRTVGGFVPNVPTLVNPLWSPIGPLRRGLSLAAQADDLELEDFERENHSETSRLRNYFKELNPVGKEPPTKNESADESDEESYENESDADDEEDDTSDEDSDEEEGDNDEELMEVDRSPTGNATPPNLNEISMNISRIAPPPMPLSEITEDEYDDQQNSSFSVLRRAARVFQLELEAAEASSSGAVEVNPVEGMVTPTATLEGYPSGPRYNADQSSAPLGNVNGWRVGTLFDDMSESEQDISITSIA